MTASGIGIEMVKIPLLILFCKLFDSLKSRIPVKVAHWSDRSQDVTGERLEARRTSVPRPVHTACVRLDRRRRVSRVYTLPYVSWSVKPYAVKPYGALTFLHTLPVPYYSLYR